MIAFVDAKKRLGDICTFDIMGPRLVQGVLHDVYMVILPLARVRRRERNGMEKTIEAG